MAVPASTHPRAAGERMALARAVPAHVVLAGLIAIGAALRVALAVAHRTPRYFPDEYIYAALARSIAHGHLTIRGTPAHFPALLEPLLASPFALAAGVETAFRLTQGLHAVASSLAAVPVYLLARRLRLPSWQCVASGAFAIALPQLVYSTYVTADAVALPLALAAVYVGVVALERPTARRQAAFVVLSGLATFGRVQYAVVPAAFVVAAVPFCGWRRPVVLRSYRLTLAMLLVPVAVAAALGTNRALGYYRGVVDLHVSPASVGRWMATDAAIFVLACGATLVPAALVGLSLGLTRPRTPAEHAFALLTTVVSLFVLVELGVYAASGAERFQERYLQLLPPLLPPLFCLGMTRMASKPLRVAATFLGVGCLVLAAALPLSGYAEALGKQDSPFLQAVSVVEDHLGKADGALVFAAAAGALALVSAAAAWRPRLGSGVVLGLALLFVCATSVAAASYDVDRSARAMRTYFPDDVRWVDHAHLGDVAVLETPGVPRATISGTLFWNTSVTRVLQMPQTDDVDAFGSSPTRVRRDGVIVADGRPFVGPLLVEEYADYAQLEGARLLERTISTSLWNPTPGSTPRLVMLANGRYLDGWLGWVTRVTVWPGASGRREGTFCMTLRMPQGVHATLDLRGPGVRRAVALAGGSAKRLALPVDTSVPWRLTVKARRPIFLADNRLVSAMSSPPRFVDGKASTAACR